MTREQALHQAHEMIAKALAGGAFTVSAETIESVIDEASGLPVEVAFK